MKLLLLSAIVFVQSFAFATQDHDIALDSFGEKFQAKIAPILSAARYMEQGCAPAELDEWKNLPLQLCSYKAEKQNARVMMLNAGPRRLTQWLQEACGTFAKDFEKCMDTSFLQIIDRSGGQFPVAGVVIEDLDGNGKGNFYPFRNGVTVKIAGIENGSEKPLTEDQLSLSFTEAPIKTFSAARPLSVTREELTAYAKSIKLEIPKLGSSAERLNIFNKVVAELYRQAWSSSENHLIRAWIFNHIEAKK